MVTPGRGVTGQACGARALAVQDRVGVAIDVELAAAAEPPLLKGIGGPAAPLEDLAFVVGLAAVGVQAGAGADILQNGQVPYRSDELPLLVPVRVAAGPL